MNEEEKADKKLKEMLDKQEEIENYATKVLQMTYNNSMEDFEGLHLKKENGIVSYYMDNIEVKLEDYGLNNFMNGLDKGQREIFITLFLRNIIRTLSVFELNDLKKIVENNR